MSDNVLYAILFSEGLAIILATSPAELIKNRLLGALADVARIMLLTAAVLYTVHKYYRGVVGTATFLSAFSGGAIAWFVTYTIKYKADGLRSLKRAARIDTESEP